MLWGDPVPEEWGDTAMVRMLARPGETMLAGPTREDEDALQPCHPQGNTTTRASNQ